MFGMNTRKAQDEARVREVSEKIEATVTGAVQKAVDGTLGTIADAFKPLDDEIRLRGEIRTLEGQVTRLKTEVEDLTLKSERKQEEFDRQEREIKHMVALETKRMEAEVAQAAKEAELKVREENVEKATTMLQDKMDFMQSRFSEESAKLQGIVTEVLNRLPKVRVDQLLRQGDLPEPRDWTPEREPGDDEPREREPRTR